MRLLSVILTDGTRCLQLPYLGMRECYVRWMREVASDHADCAMRKCVVADACYKLLIDKKVQVASTSYDGKDICLAGSRFDGGTCIFSERRVEIVAPGEKKGVIAIMPHAKVVKVGVGIIRAENESTFVPLDDSHLCLEGKIAKVGSLCEASHKVVLLQDRGV